MVKSTAETRMWVVDGIANSLRPWFNKVSGSVHDARGLKVIEDLYQWHYRSERYLRNVEPIARVAMVYSQQTAQFYGGAQARAKVEDYTLGMYQALIGARIPFEMVHDRLLDAEHTSRYKLLLLPNIAALSERSARTATTSSRRQPPGYPETSLTTIKFVDLISAWPTCSVCHSKHARWPHRELPFVSRTLITHCSRGSRTRKC